MVLLLRCLTVPVLEICRPCVEAVGSLADAPELTVELVAVLTNGLIHRLQDPKAVSSAPGDATLLITDACVGALIDLHSSDNAEILSCFLRFGCLAVLEHVLIDFQAKVMFADLNLRQMNEYSSLRPSLPRCLKMIGSNAKRPS